MEERHLHGFGEIVIFTEGRYEGQVGDERFTTEPGDVVVYRAGQKHWEANDPEHPPAFYVIRYRWPDMPADFPFRVHDRYGRIRIMAQWLNERWWWKDPRYDPAYADGLFHAIISEILHAFWASSTALGESIRHYISQNLARPLTVKDLACHVNMSRSRFCRVYRATAHATPMQELRRVRLAVARQLLQTTDLPAKAIARRVGLADEASLAHLFRKYLKMTPTDVRHGSGKTREEAAGFLFGLSEC